MTLTEDLTTEEPAGGPEAAGFPTLTPANQEATGPADSLPPPPTPTPQEPVPPATELPPSTDGLAAQLDAYLQQIGFVGVVLVSQNDDIVFEKGYGMADEEAEIPNTPDTQFRFASVSKAFTAAAIMIAQEEGLLDIDDTIGVYATGFVYGDQVTIRHLLGHTSGIQPRPQDFHEGPPPIDFEEAMEQIRNQPLMFEPGTQYAYSNDGYRILGFLLEQVTGEDYGDFIQTRILDPVGMAHTAIDHNQVLPNRAVGYNVVGSGAVEAVDPIMDFVGAAGQMIGTAGDLYLWDRALASYELMSVASQQEMFSQRFGWFVTTEFSQGTSGLVVQHHGGILPGFRNHIVRIPELDAAIVLLSNFRGTDDETISRSLAGILAANRE